ncbi:MAG: hypothetical protein A2096_07110 [Spirochaetes bacterium GWF1_41_5]|nr:MAG: hypothetical protein A2096_07110 [Spirochaetes bacterium GWF1_41_5]HBE02864.1 hypothetical protein [Spirochaetia bacterium]
MKINTGEEEFQKNIEKLQKDSLAAAPRYKISVLKYLLNANVRKLIEEHASLRLENDQIKEALGRSEKEARAYELQVRELMKIDFNDFDVIRAKADRYDNCEQALKSVREHYKKFSVIVEKRRIAALLASGLEQITETKDSIQKLKIYKQLITALRDFSLAADSARNFLENENNFRNIRPFEDFIESMRRLSETENELKEFTGRCHEEITKALEL